MDRKREAKADLMNDRGRGTWLRTEAAPHKVYCSVCYETYLLNEKWAEELPITLHPKFCPNCGVQMEVDSNE